ncbi:lambda phage CII family protein [Providencia rettgeri]|uniref:CII family transcriptional regulator n=1 Tax=Providencia rettgeri TaxID=587 RepID=UPI001CFF3C1D|nr:CII family transcriptional regulator [Providencia rettgeri]EIU7559318.1 transcriptional regulator [Providencia rettgeri]MCB4843245.1 lambda phage CII family protein [Providencia rettgeri]MCG5278042.1 lambda phage CII family protein [Providencia rettgeri]MCG9509018.1 lambda phage CII family protein [Providencia rettgeri]
MDYAISRNVRAIEARIRKGIILTTPKKVAKAVGVHESQITRWQAENGFVEKAARLLDAIGFDAPIQDVIIQGDEARALIQMLEHVRYPKRKASTVAPEETQIELL